MNFVLADQTLSRTCSGCADFTIGIGSKRATMDGKREFEAEVPRAVTVSREGQVANCDSARRDGRRAFRQGATAERRFG
jgi:hypothetical protein